jgi:hypothetical protein
MKIKNEKEFNKVFHDDFTGIIEWCDGTEDPNRVSIRYFKNREYHNENGPAYSSFETKQWCLRGILHRENGPAIEFTNGRKEEWWLNGNLTKTTVT